MFTRVAMDVGSVPRSNVSPPRKCPTTVDITSSSTSLFTLNHVDQDAKEDFAIVCEITLIIDVLNVLWIYLQERRKKEWSRNYSTYALNSCTQPGLVSCHNLSYFTKYNSVHLNLSFDWLHLFCGRIDPLWNFPGSYQIVIVKTRSSQVKTIQWSSCGRRRSTQNLQIVWLKIKHQDQAYFVS